MATSLHLFRGLLLLHVALGLIAPALFPGTPAAEGGAQSGVARLGAVLLRLFPSLDGGALAGLILAAAALYALAQAVAVLALFDFRPWAPGFALAVLPVAAGLKLLAGPFPAGLGETLVNGLALVLLGAILAMAHSSPLAGRFERAREPDEARGSADADLPVLLMAPRFLSAR